MMKHTWIALIRGINVGGKNKVNMKELTQLMEEKGFGQVQTYIQSGNVVFRSESERGDEMATLIEESFGFRPAVFIMSGSYLRKAAEQNPYPVDAGKMVHFFFCDQAPTNVDFDFLESLRLESESYKLIDRVFYLYAPEGIGRSKLAEKMGRAFKGVTMTARNLNTIDKLLEMIGD
jgi:uncharacterized protein (DUF1697 family)